MRVAINALSASVGGGRTYLTNLLPALHTIAPSFDWVIYVHSRQPDWLRAVRAACPNFIWRELRAPIKSPWGRGIYEQFVLPSVLSEDDVTLLYSVADVLPLRFRGRNLLAVRNLTLYTRERLDWGLQDKARIAVLRRLSHLSVKYADHLVFVSHDSRQWISHALGVPLDKSTAIPHGVGTRFFTADARDLPPGVSERIRGAPYVLSVSSMYPYKNYLRLIEAFEMALALSALPHHLVIVGAPVARSYARRLSARVCQSPRQDRIHLVDEVPYEAMPGLYRSAAAMVFPSYLETFGHPLLEAMACGIPVAASDIPVFRELARTAAVFFNPFSAQEMATALRRVIEDKALRNRLESEGHTRARLFSWERTARRLTEVVQILLGVNAT